MRSYKNYTDDNLNEALTEVAEGKMSMYAASKKYVVNFFFLSVPGT